jgi:hypothetical protein
MSPSEQLILFFVTMKERGLQIHLSFGICHQISTLMYLDISHYNSRLGHMHEQHMGLAMTFCLVKFFSYFSLLLLQVFTFFHV